MKLVVIYRPNSEHATQTESYLREFQRRNADVTIELLNVDSREGIAMASLYDVVQYPGLLALRVDGSVASMWQGSELPLIDEIAGYARS